MASTYAIRGVRITLRALLALVAIVVAALLLSILGPPGAANAAIPSRVGLPLVAGKEVRMQHGGDCTAGVVLKKNGIFAFLSAKERATRYVVIAKHCVSTPNEGILAGTDLVGQVIQTDPDYDIALARVDPLAHQQTFCHHTSFGVTCNRSYTYTPRAAGRVILSDPRTRGDGAIPFNGSGDPRADEHFCTSGAMTGVNCDFVAARIPSLSTWARLGLPRAARNDSFSPIPGDSGGPVVSTTGKFYGILTDAGNQTTDPAIQNLIAYVDSSKVFAFARGYSIAPPS